MDYLVAGEEVDCKWSVKLGGWMIPTRPIDKICLLVWADDYSSKYSIGLVRPPVSSWAHRTRTGSVGSAWPVWTHDLACEDGDLPENILLHLSAGGPGQRSSSEIGQQRVNELFRRVQRRDRSS